MQLVRIVEDTPIFTFLPIFASAPIKTFDPTLQLLEISTPISIIEFVPTKVLFPILTLLEIIQLFQLLILYYFVLGKILAYFEIADTGFKPFFSNL